MAKVRYDGKEYEIPDSEDWTTGELSEAEHAIGAAFGGASQGDAMSIGFYIAIRRIDSDTPNVMLADACRKIKMRDLLSDEEEEADPLDAEKPSESNGHAGQQTIGAPLSEASVSPSTFATSPSGN